MKPHTLVVLNGTLTSDLQEEWTCTLRVLGGVLGAATAPIDEADLDTYLSQIQTAVAAWFQAANTAVPVTCKLTELKANNIGPDGKYLSLNTHYYTYPAPLTGGGGPNPGLDIINSLVYSWRTSARARGAASKGRMYPPNFAVAQSAGSGKVSDAVRATAWTQASAFLNAIRNNGNSIKAAPVLISTTNDDWSYIDRIAVDNIIDVQRRRKNQLQSTYLTGVWP